MGDLQQGLRYELKKCCGIYYGTQGIQVESEVCCSTVYNRFLAQPGLLSESHCKTTHSRHVLNLFHMKYMPTSEIPCIGFIAFARDIYENRVHGRTD